MQSGRTKIDISIHDQLLTVKRGDETLRSYPVSSSRFGLGTEEGSMKTPTGRFRIAEKIGGSAPSGTVFQSRVPLKPGDPFPPSEDLVMSRILWLDGLEEHNANTRERFIYIHGTKHEEAQPVQYCNRCHHCNHCCRRLWRSASAPAKVRPSTVPQGFP